MPKILLITVGGSPQPIVTSIESLQPDRIIFICSGGSRGSVTQVTGDGRPCEFRNSDGTVERKVNLSTLLQLGKRFNELTDLVVFSNPDDLSEIYLAIAEKIREIQEQNPDAEILADYTGGTKTMSVALGIAALDYHATMYLTTSGRTDLIRVTRGERVRRAPVTTLAVERLLSQDLPGWFGQYNYPAIVAKLGTLLQDIELPQVEQIEEYLRLARGLDAWDRFDHAEAWQDLAGFMSYTELRSLLLFLKRVMGSRAAIAEAMDSEFCAPDLIRGHGYELVEDLLLNAERRAKLARYDDAIGRLYRALELLVQIRLWKEYAIKTGNVDLEKLPEASRPNYQTLAASDGKIQLGLRNSYQLLTHFNHDPLGELYQRQEQQIFDRLQIRNYSILAHGLRPVTQTDYEQQFEAVIIPFLQEGLDAIAPKRSKQPAVQFPDNFAI
jgi:CRISPR-associated protein (TIGR02710 family)